MFTHQKGDAYVITGVDCAGRRFTRHTDNPHYAMGFNVWRGTLWQVRGGKRRRVHRWWN